MRTNRDSILGLLAALVLLTGSGCTTSLAGNWEGEIDCGSWGDVDMELDIDDAQGMVFAGDGEITGFYYENSPAKLVFEVELTKTKLSGVQELAIDPDDCEVEISGYGSYDEDCEEPDDVEWDGEDEITGEIEDFLGISGNDCEFEIER